MVIPERPAHCRPPPDPRARRGVWPLAPRRRRRRARAPAVSGSPVTSQGTVLANQVLAYTLTSPQPFRPADWFADYRCPPDTWPADSSDSAT